MDDSELVNNAVKVLREGGVIIFPTDTVWGIGASIQRLDGIEKLYKIKSRPKTKPTAVLVSSISQATEIAFLDQKAKDLIDKFWPGGLTLVVKAKPFVPKIIKGAKETIGIRMPNHKLALKMLNQLGCGIVAASANFASQPPPVEKEMINPQLIDLCGFMIEGTSGGGLPSTVVDITVEPFEVIRQGPVEVPA